jgi:hypothetical protein
MLDRVSTVRVRGLGALAAALLVGAFGACSDDDQPADKVAVGGNGAPPLAGPKL